jgi:hypothetical protein
MEAKFLNIESSSNILDIIDNEKLLDLHKDRLELFLFAAAIGGLTPTPLNSLKSIVRPERVKSSVIGFPYLTAISVSNMKGNDLNNLVNSEKIFKFADQCANTGFKVIEDIAQNQRDVQGYIGDLLDSKYDELQAIED